MMTSGSHRSAEPTPRFLSEESLEGIDQHLKHREERREEIHQRARKLRRLAQGTMTRIHEGRGTGSELSDLHAQAKELAGFLEREGRGDAGLARDAFQECAEALLLGAIVGGTPAPSPEEIPVDPEVYLTAMGDLVGEVRRLVLHRLSASDLDGAERHLSLMDELYQDLMRFDTTRAIVALKPKQDQARALVERTRGDVTLARMLARTHLPPPAASEDP
jgi:translin